MWSWSSWFCYKSDLGIKNWSILALKSDPNRSSGGQNRHPKSLRVLDRKKEGPKSGKVIPKIGLRSLGVDFLEPRGPWGRQISKTRRSKVEADCRAGGLKSGEFLHIFLYLLHYLFFIVSLLVSLLLTLLSSLLFLYFVLYLFLYFFLYLSLYLFLDFFFPDTSWEFPGGLLGLPKYSQLGTLRSEPTSISSTSPTGKYTVYYIQVGD